MINQGGLAVVFVYVYCGIRACLSVVFVCVLLWYSRVSAQMPMRDCACFVRSWARVRACLRRRYSVTSVNQLTRRLILRCSLPYHLVNTRRYCRWRLSVAFSRFGDLAETSAGFENHIPPCKVRPLARRSVKVINHPNVINHPAGSSTGWFVFAFVTCLVLPTGDPGLVSPIRMGRNTMLVPHRIPLTMELQRTETSQKDPCPGAPHWAGAGQQWPP